MSKILIPLALCGLGLAQVYTGKVVDTQGKALAMAQIRLQNQTQWSDSNGNYALDLGSTAIMDKERMQLHGSSLSWQQNHSETLIFKIWNAQGQLLWQQKMDATPGLMTFELPPLALGFLTIHSSQGMQVFELRPAAQVLARASQSLATIDSIYCIKPGFKTQALSLLNGVYNYDFMLQAQGSTLLKMAPTGFRLRLTSTGAEDLDFAQGVLDYQVLSPGMLQDKITGLIWTKQESPSLGAGDAFHYCDTLSLGQKHWRLPDAHEAYSIQNLGKTNPSLDTAVWGKSIGEYWWTQTLGKDKSGRLWLTNMGGGLGSHDTLESKASGGTKMITARCVAQDLGKNQAQWQIISDSIVLDLNTGLQWMRFPLDSNTWENQLLAARNLRVGAYSDWRLPNIKELQSINDENLYAPSLDSLVFPNVKKWLKTTNKGNARLYWSSTGMKDHADSVWTLDFNSGLVSYANRKTLKLFGLAVRGVIP